MMSRDWETERRSKPLFTFTSAGWILVIAFLFAIALGVRAIWPALTEERLGDRKTVSSYGFDTSNLSVKREGLEARGMVKDGLKAMVMPPMTDAARVQRINEQSHTKYIVSSDRVIGVNINGESRAYPIRVLNWHEVVNDIVGGVPVAVTYSPQCDGVAVFSRRLGDETLEFGVSGLLYQADLVFYDRREDNGQESLWCQLMGQAISGPLVGKSLELLPCQLTSWGDWKELHPDTHVIDPDPDMKKTFYKKNPYRRYLASDELKVIVRPSPPLDGPAAMTEVLVVPSNVNKVFLADKVCSQADNNGEWTVDNLRFRCSTLEAEPEPVRSVTVTSSDPQSPAPPVFYCRWFAWYALHPDSEPS